MKNIISNTTLGIAAFLGVSNNVMAASFNKTLFMVLTVRRVYYASRRLAYFVIRVEVSGVHSY